jgi:pyruvate dehydrogenase E1 component
MYNETYPQPALPEGSADGILKGMYRLSAGKGKVRPQLLGSGPILREVLRAHKILQERFDIDADVWSVTSYKELRRAALVAERWNLLHPEEKPRISYVEECLNQEAGPVIATSDFLRLVPEQIARWAPGGMVVLGTDGFGRSDDRAALRRHFEVDAEHIAFATLSALHRRAKLDARHIRRALQELRIDPDKIDPANA